MAMITPPSVICLKNGGIDADESVMMAMKCRSVACIVWILLAFDTDYSAIHQSNGRIIAVSAYLQGQMFYMLDFYNLVTPWCSVKVTHLQLARPIHRIWASNHFPGVHHNFSVHPLMIGSLILRRHASSIVWLIPLLSCLCTTILTLHQHLIWFDSKIHAQNVC